MLNVKFIGIDDISELHSFVLSSCFVIWVFKFVFQIQHAFIKQLKKSSKVPLENLIPEKDFIAIEGPSEDEDSLTMAMDTKMVIDEVEWDFSTDVWKLIYIKSYSMNSIHFKESRWHKHVFKE